MRLDSLYQVTRAEVMSSRSARVSIGPVRNGEPSRTHSVLYSPIVVSHSPLSRASPTVPIDGLSLRSSVSGCNVLRCIDFRHRCGGSCRRVGGRLGLDAQVAGKVTAAIAGVSDTFPQAPARVAPPIDSQVRAVDNHTFKQDPPPSLPIDPNDMTADEARAEWARVNADIRAWNARCGIENVGPLPPAQYSACLASRGPLLERQAAVRARLGQLGIPVEGEDPGHSTSAEPPFPPPKRINGFTSHGRESVEDHDGHGVNDSALQDAVEHPVEPPRYEVDEQGRGAYTYRGKDATVVLNGEGQVVTAWPRSHQGWRHQ